jgi:bifunctional non-homologous end joining protein LigD
LWRSDLPAARAAVVLKAPADAPTEAEIAALDEMTRDGPWHVFGRELRITNLDKVMFDPRGGEPAVTKRDLVRYAAQIAPTVLPYLRHRAVIMHRYPGGAAGRGIWQRELPEHAPQWLPRWDNPEADSGEPHTYLVVDEPAALVWAANFGAVEWHAWTSLVDAPHQPTYALVDLDPASDPASDPGKSMDWSDLLVLARLYRTAVEHLGLTAGVKVTGRRGIQIWIPVARGPGFDETRAWVEQLSKSIGAVVPELVSRQVGDRAGRARLDYTRNAIDRTLVAPYSPRAAAGAPVSAPITWQELDDPALQPDRWTVRTIGERIAAAGDPFRDLENSAQRLPVLR